MAFSLLNLFGGKTDKNKDIEEHVPENTGLEERMHVPEKVFIEREGAGYEYSELAPASISRINQLLNGYYCNQNFLELFYCLPEIFAPIHEIASRVADANWQLKNTWNDEVAFKDADFNRLFTQPNPLQNFKSFVYESVVYEILTGKQLWFFNQSEFLGDDYKSIITWYNLPAADTYAKVKKSVDPYTATEIADYADYWWTADQRGGKRIFPTKRVLPILNLSLKERWDINKTKSYLLGAEKPIKNLIPVYEARGTIFIKRGALGLIVSKKGDMSGQIALTPKEKAEVNAEFNNAYGLTGGRDTVSITAQPVDFIRTAMSIAELEPFDETLSDAVAIYATLRVPRHLVPSKDQSTFANADADIKSFYDNVIIPWAKKYAEAWNNYMKLSDFRKYIYPDFSHVAVLQENRKEKSDVEKTMGAVWSQRWLSGACTLNDWITSNEGEKVTGNPLYEKKIFELDDKELELLKKYLNLKSNAKDAPEDSRTKEKSSADTV